MAAVRSQSIFGSPPTVHAPSHHNAPYRARNKRSCDFCRGRKTACRIDDRPPCFACKSSGRQCSFAERPPKRRRISDGYNHSQPGILSPGMEDIVFDQSPKSSTSQEQHQVGRQSVSTSPADTNVFMMPSDTSYRTPAQQLMGDSLDSIPDKTAFLLGDTGESDPYLSRHFAPGPGDRSFVSKVQCRHIDVDFDDPPGTGRPLVFYLADHSLYDHGEPRLDDSMLNRLSDEIDAICNHEISIRLARLYFRFVYPYFPIISSTHYLSNLSERLKQSPLSLRAALIATGLPFVPYDDVLATTLVHSLPSAQRLWQIVWLAASHEAHTPHLATLQSCLLLLQRVNDDRYVMDTTFRWSLIAWSVALAQSLGLPTDCSNWKQIPAWEKRLRRRLWWAIYVVDKWSFMSAGLASHIRHDDFDVSPLTATDFVVGEADESEGNETHPASHFFHLVELSRTLADILDSFFSVRASAKTQRHFGLSLSIARPLRTRLKEWKTNFDAYISTIRSNSQPSPSKLDGNASLGLAYPVATIILFRALLRPLESPALSEEDAHRMAADREAVRVGAKACCIESVEFVEGLQRNVWDAFWHSWSRAGFATVSSLMVRMLITSESQTEKVELSELIRRWRWALRTGGGNSGNVLMSLGLLRLDRSLITKGIYEADDDM